MINKPTIFQTPSFDINNRVDFNETEFDSLVWEKGRTCVVEKSLRCPCKSESINELSSCKNCGGLGWVFINPRRTRMVLQSMSISTQFKNWSEEDRGTIKISAMHREELSFMDRITVEDGESIYSEVIHFSSISTVNETILSAFLRYEPKEVLYCSLFINTEEKLKRLELGVDFTVEGRKIILSNENNSIFYIPDYSYNSDKPSITIRYKHNPVFHVIEMNRETMQSYKEDEGKERVINLPVSCMARRSHFILNSGVHVSSDIILDNSYQEDECKWLSLGGFKVKIPCINSINDTNLILSPVVWVESEGKFYFKNSIGVYSVIELPNNLIVN